MADDRRRCPWCGDDPLYVAYHDDQWGVPVRDERMLFEMLTLEGAQAGLSWLTILRKREGYRQAFADFEPARVARFGDDDIAALLANPAIVRNRAKIVSAIGNARALLALAESGTSFTEFVWGFVDGEPLVNAHRRPADVPAETPISRAMSRSLKQHGFRFCGPIICYAFMQSTGLVNDHLTSCYRHAELRQQRC